MTEARKSVCGSVDQLSQGPLHLLACNCRVHSRPKFAHTKNKTRNGPRLLSRCAAYRPMADNTLLQGLLGTRYSLLIRSACVTIRCYSLRCKQSALHTFILHRQHNGVNHLVVVASTYTFTVAQSLLTRIVAHRKTDIQLFLRRAMLKSVYVHQLEPYHFSSCSRPDTLPILRRGVIFSKHVI